MSAVPASWKRRRVGSIGTPKSKTSGPKQDDLSIEKLLIDDCEKPKVTLYHMRERMPAMEKAGGDMARYKSRLAALHAAEALRPSSVGKLEDDLLSQHLVTLQPFWSGPLPLVTCKGLVQRRSERVMKDRNIARCIEIVWPESSQEVFNAEEARVATLAMSQEEKVRFAHDMCLTVCRR